MREKLIDAGLISINQFTDTRDLFKEDPKNHKLRSHKISCKGNQTLISLTVLPNTQFRIMVNMKDCCPETAIFSWIGKHREYERIIKDSKNCKSLFVECKDIVHNDPKEIETSTS